MVSVIGNTTRLPPFPMPDDLPGAEIDLRPAQGDALGLPQSAGPDEVEERAIVIPHRIIERRRFVVLQLAHALQRLRQQ